MAVNVCVIGAGVAITPGISLYGASKHAVRGFTLTLAAELRDKGVAVTCICPGLGGHGNAANPNRSTRRCDLFHHG